MKMQKFVISLKKSLKINTFKIKNIIKLEIGALIRVNTERSAAHSICNVSYSVHKETLMLFHNRSNYDYHFIKELAEESQGKINCLEEDTEKIHNLFSSNRKTSDENW